MRGVGKDVRLAIAGAGLIGKRHAKAMARAQGAGLCAIVDPAPAGHEFAAAKGVAWFAALDEMIGKRCADGVILSTPSQMHVAGALACVRAGLPVLVEKPLATELAEARMLVETAEAAGVPVLTGHHRRHNPLIAAAKALIEAGEIGTPVSVQSMFWLFKPDDYFDTAWRRKAGGGPVFLNLIHDVDVLRHLLGEVMAVQAAQSSAVRGNAVEESAVITFEFVNGALGGANVSDTIPAPWSWEMTTGENPAYPRTDQACYLIGGTHGALELPSGRLWHHQGRRGWWEPLSARTSPRASGDPLVRQIEQFARVIEGREPPLVSGREGLRTLAVIEAIKEAARTGRRVVLGE